MGKATIMTNVNGKSDMTLTESETTTFGQALFTVFAVPSDKGVATSLHPTDRKSNRGACLLIAINKNLY
jgi:hypothetical protein